LKTVNVQGGQAPAKRQKKGLKIVRTHPWRPQLNNPWACGTVGISYGVCQEILDILNMCCIATKCVPRLLTHYGGKRLVNGCLKLQEKVNDPPTEWFHSFPNWKWNWTDDILQQLSDIQRELQAVLDRIKGKRLPWHFWRV
jgi:hypothetical protein